MGDHINRDGQFQSDKYPTCPPGKVPLSVKDMTAQDLLWRYAERRRAVDDDFSNDLKHCLYAAGYIPAIGMLDTVGMCHALRMAASQFRRYETSHRAKGTPEGDEKAETNRRFAELCEAMLP